MSDSQAPDCEVGDARYARYRRALGDTPPPAAIVDLDAVDANAERLMAPLRAHGKALRIATKSLRCPELLRHLIDRGAGAVAGLMTYSAAETAFLAGLGHSDLLLAYPTVHPADLRALATANRPGVTAAAVADCPEHVAALALAAAAAGTTIPVVIDVDASYRPLGPALHVGVRRSPLRDPAEVAALGERIASTPGLHFHGLLCYEAQIAGLTDASPFTPAGNLLFRVLKSRSRRDVERIRGQCLEALRARGLAPRLVNGGGTGSVHSSAADETLTEVTCGSGFLDSLLFDYYRDLSLLPAACFALQVVRRPAPGIVTCHGGGYVASGQAGPDRLPRPWLPPGLDLLPMEGAGEVQTPLRVRSGPAPALGDPVFFRHAKAGELAEHFNEYLFVRGDRVVLRAPTYRGLGQCFLG